MRGHIRERSPGCWAVVLDITDPQTGKRRRKWHSFRGGKREAQRECARLIAQQGDGGYIEPAKITTADFLARWLDYKKARLSPLSFERYRDLVRVNIAPAIGGIPLAKLQPIHLTDLYSKLLESLSARSVTYVHRILKQALGEAVSWQMLSRNLADVVKPPKVERREMACLDSNGIAALLEASRNTSLYMPILIAVSTGMRRGEIVALRWRNVDFDNASIAVVSSIEQTREGTREKPPKNGRGRTLALSAMLVEELRQHRAQQAEHLLRLGVRLTDDHHVVMKADGSPYPPLSVGVMFSQLLSRRPSLQRVRFHDLRHSHATQLLAAGVHPKIAQERLGHSSIAMTMDLYSHVTPNMQQDAAAKVDALLRQALAKTQRGTR
jgi:integrase